MESPAQDDANMRQFNAGGGQNFQSGLNGDNPTTNQFVGDQHNHHNVYATVNQQVQQQLSTCEQQLAQHKAAYLEEFQRRGRLKQKLDEAERCLIAFKKAVWAELSELNTDRSSVVFSLFQELLDVFEQEEAIVEIRHDLEACEQAYVWLKYRKEEIARYLGEVILSNDHAYYWQANISREIVVTPQTIASYQEDIETYLSWLLEFLRDGDIPDDFDRQVSLIFPESLYKEGFRRITIDWIDPQFSGMSIDAAEQLASYINRLLIDRPLRPSQP